MDGDLFDQHLPALDDTYSNYRNLDEPTCTRMLGAIADMIDHRHSGRITKRDLAVLLLAGKRGGEPS
ncbi:MAG: hypothetical protein ABI679_07205 [Gemmatimonadota bacterium]